jgi:hypothetical protein
VQFSCSTACMTFWAGMGRNSHPSLQLSSSEMAPCSQHEFDCWPIVTVRYSFPWCWPARAYSPTDRSWCRVVHTPKVLPVLEATYDMGNLAAVCRSADAFGFGALHYIKRQ